jgi:hypothetical protein
VAHARAIPLAHDCVGLAGRSRKDGTDEPD